MLQKGMDLLKSHRWFGTFYSSEESDKKFSGTLKYSPQKGVRLTYLIDKSAIPVRTHVIHGVLDSGEICTLLGEFDVEGTVGEVRCGDFRTKIGVWGFSYLLLGIHATERTKFSVASVTFPELDQIFTHFKGLHENFSNAALFESRLEFGKILARSWMEYDLLHDFDLQLHTEDTYTRAILNEAFGKLKAHDERVNIRIKGDLNYRFDFEFDASSTINEISMQVDVLANLLSLIYYHPAIPETINISSRDDKRFQSAKLYVSDVRDKRTVKLCRPRLINHQMPISARTTDMSRAIQKWFSLAEKFSVFVLNIQSQTGFINTFQLYGYIVVLCTHLEDISIEDGEHKKKWEYSIGNYATKATLFKLEQLFNVEGSKNLGIKLGKLRSDIAHVKTGRKTLAGMTASDLAKISQCLELIVISYIFIKLKIERSTVDAFQNLHSPPMK